MTVHNKSDIILFSTGTCKRWNETLQIYSGMLINLTHFTCFRGTYATYIPFYCPSRMQINLLRYQQFDFRKWGIEFFFSFFGDKILQVPNLLKLKQIGKKKLFSNLYITQKISERWISHNIKWSVSNIRQNQLRSSCIGQRLSQFNVNGHIRSHVYLPLSIMELPSPTYLRYLSIIFSSEGQPEM